MSEPEKSPENQPENQPDTSLDTTSNPSSTLPPETEPEVQQPEAPARKPDATAVTYGDLGRAIAVVLLVGVALAAVIVESRRFDPAPEITTDPESTEPLPTVPLPQPPNVVTRGNVFAAPDNSAEIERVPGWQPEPGLNPIAQIQVANPEDDMYMIVLSQSKEELGGITIEEHSELARQVLTSRLSQSETLGPSDEVAQVAGYPAIQHQIYGSLNDINVVYLHTTVETPQNFVQLLAWTATADFQRLEPEMQRLIQSFREPENGDSGEGVSPTPPSPAPESPAPESPASEAPAAPESSPVPSPANE